MGIVIGAKPDSSFANPLGLLSDCHRRIEKFLQTLIALVSEAQEVAEIADRKRNEDSALNESQRHALETALRYFREAAPRHMRDEEESLFPKMRSCDSADARSALEAIDALEADHQSADIGHLDVDRLGRQWLAEGRLTRQEIISLNETLQGLQSLYRNHINIEDTRIFPLAAQILDSHTIAAVGKEMAERRGINLNTLPDLKVRCPTRLAAVGTAGSEKSDD